jgi:hypothetical protein
MMLKLVFTAPHEQKTAGHWWLTPAILATQEAEIRRTNSSRDSISKKPITKKGQVE